MCSQIRLEVTVFLDGAVHEMNIFLPFFPPVFNTYKMLLDNLVIFLPQHCGFPFIFPTDASGFSQTHSNKNKKSFFLNFSF